MVVSAITHVALIPDHASDPIRQGLFGLDAVALCTIFGFALLRVPGWRLMARLLLASAVVAYVYYIWAGWESIDTIGLFTKVVEVLAIALLWLPDDPGWAFVRIHSQR